MYQCSVQIHLTCPYVHTTVQQRTCISMWTKLVLRFFLAHLTWAAKSIQNCTWYQPQTLRGRGLRTGRCNNHTSFTGLLASGMKIELANSVLEPDTTPPPHTHNPPTPFHCLSRHPWLSTTLRGQMETPASERDPHILFFSSPWTSSLHTWTDVTAPPPCLYFSQYISDCRSFFQPDRRNKGLLNSCFISTTNLNPKGKW